MVYVDEDDWPGLFLKKAPDLITNGCEPPCGCWELNSEPLEEQTVLLTPEPPLQLPV